MDDPLICPDPQAERRWSYGRLLAAEADWAGARDLFEQCLERAPGFAPAWSDLGQALERLDDRAAAGEAYSRAAALDPPDRLGAKARLARLEGQEPTALSPAYVARLFDDYAKRFDRHLRESLHYSGPELIAEALDAQAPARRFASALDLGCGTGLAGVPLRQRAERLEGVDLSARMVEEARKRGLYDALTVGEAEAFLAAAAPDRYDCIAAADVLGYLGDLRPIFRAAARALTPGGLFVFTVETLFADEGFALAESMRFRHSRGYLEAQAEAAGFAVRSIHARSSRIDLGVPVAGLLVALQRSSAA